jgi:hypothetical protein
MTAKSGRAGAVPVSDLATALLDPVLRKRAGMSVALVQSWDEIVGHRLAAATRPERIAWPRRMNEDDPFEPAALIIACEGAMALRLQHETGEIIARVNAFLGFGAIGRIRIVQKPVNAPVRAEPKPPRALRSDEAGRLAATVGQIEDDGLRAALERLGRSVIGSKR